MSLVFLFCFMLPTPQVANVVALLLLLQMLDSFPFPSNALGSVQAWMSHQTRWSQTPPGPSMPAVR